MALEWVDGETLGRWVDARESTEFTTTEALDLMTPVLDALALPSTVTCRRPSGHPAWRTSLIWPGILELDPFASRVTDFGIAKVMAEAEADRLAQRRTRSRPPLHLFYTSGNAAPGRGRNGVRTGPWTDVHALALIFVELLIGTTAA